MINERLVYVQFASGKAQDPGQQRALWYQILSEGISCQDLDTLAFRERMRLCWLPHDYKESLNLMFSFTSLSPALVRRELQIMHEQVFIGAKTIGTVDPEDAPLIPDDASRVIQLMQPSVVAIDLRQGRLYAA